MPEQPNGYPSELEALLSSREPAAVLDAILGSLPSGVVIARAPDGKIVRISDYVALILRRHRSDLEGQFVRDANERAPAYDEAGRRLSPEERPLAKALRGESVSGFEYRIETAEGERIPMAINAAPIRNWNGDLIGAISSITDMRPYKALEQGLRDALAQRETLYRELTHRVKNHLQIMTALISLEARNPELTAKGLAEQIKGQMRALAAVYNGMDRADSGARIEARTFVEEVCRPYATAVVQVDAAVQPDDLTLPSDQAGPVGMLVNEAVANSCKHAFPHRNGRIEVSLRRLGPSRLRLEVADDGVGWGPDGPRRTSHGLDLMRLFARQMQGELELSERPLGGAVVAAEIQEPARP